MLKRIGSLIEEVLEGIVPTQSTQITSVKPNLYPEFNLRSPAMRKRGVVDVPPAPTTGHKREDTTVAFCFLSIFSYEGLCLIHI